MIENLTTTISRPQHKIIWLDTHFIWRAGTEFWKKLAPLVLQNKVILLDTGQFTEMSEGFVTSNRNPSDEQAQTMKIYAALVGNFFAIDHNTYLSRQIEVAMSAYQSRDDEVIYLFNDLFDGFLSEMAETLDVINQFATEKWGTQSTFKKMSSSVAEDWQLLQSGLKGTRVSLEKRRQNEQLAMAAVIEKVANSSDVTKKKNLVDHYLRMWGKYSHNKDLDQMLKFFRSEYFQTIPYEDVRTWLAADLLKGNRIISSDYFDVLMVSMALPFCDYMIVDADTKQRIKTKAKLVSPTGKYKCEVLKPSEVDVLLKGIPGA